MTENSEFIGLTTRYPQNEVVAQSMQQTTVMRPELQQIRESENFVIAAGTPFLRERMSPLYSHSLNPSENIPSNPHITPTQKLPTLDLIVPNPRHVSFSYHTLSSPRNLNPNSSKKLSIACHIQNLSVIQPMPLKAAFHESYLPYPTYTKSNHYEEKENEWRPKEEMSIKEEIAKAMKQYHYTPDIVGLNYEDLCIHPDLDLPEGFKIPKFDTFDGTGNPLTHLKFYCNQLVGVGGNKPLLMRLFSRSLKGEALEWFTSQELKQWLSWTTLTKDFVERFEHNIQVAPDHYYLEKIKQKSIENYREYALRWRREAARVQPPMSECEITKMFICIQKPEYYERMLCMMGCKFIDVVMVEETLEDDFKTGKITLRVNERIIKTSDVEISMKEEEEVSAIRAIPSKRYQKCHVKQGNFSRPSFKKPPKVFTPLKESQTQLYERLKAAGMLHPIKGRPTNPFGKFYRADHKYAYHSEAIGHDTENCSTLKHKTQNMLDKKLITID